MQAIQIGKDKYEIASDELRLTVGYLHQVAKNIGIKPNGDTLIEGSAWKLVDAMFQMWAAHFPWEIKAFKESIQDDQSIERTPHEANKKDGGHIPISYPTRLYKLIKLYFPKEHLADRELIIKFVKRYPILKVTKYGIGD